MRSFTLSVRLVVILLGAAVACRGEPPQPRGATTRPTYPPKGMANAYDVVAFVEEGVAREGTRDFQLVHAGGLYAFANEANRARFKAEPERYTPAFDGWCACSMAKGMRMSASGRDFQVVDGRLYLFHDAGMHAEWQKDSEAMIERAAANWADMK